MYGLSTAKFLLLLFNRQIRKKHPGFAAVVREIRLMSSATDSRSLVSGGVRIVVERLACYGKNENSGREAG